jgi:sporulenol synthase
LTTTLLRGTLVAMNELAARFLLRSQNPDGGWGYRVGGMSFVEPTAASLIAQDDIGARKRGRDFLLGLQQNDGGWGIAAMDAESGWMTAWAVIALSSYDPAETRDAVAGGATWLLGHQSTPVTDPGLREASRKRLRIDSSLRGWSWQTGDSAWVHPTSLAMRALTAAGRRDASGLQDGIAYLFDRAVESGGWNIGNPYMLDKKIPATIQDTAVALMALHSAGISSNPRIAEAIQYLRNMLAIAQTPAELAWGIYALREWQQVVGDSIARLNSMQGADGSWSGNPFITAIATLSQV